MNQDDVFSSPAFVKDVQDVYQILDFLPSNSPTTLQLPLRFTDDTSSVNSPPSLFVSHPSDDLSHGQHSLSIERQQRVLIVDAIDALAVQQTITEDQFVQLQLENESTSLALTKSLQQPAQDQKQPNHKNSTKGPKKTILKKGRKGFPDLSFCQSIEEQQEELHDPNFELPLSFDDDIKRGGFKSRHEFCNQNGIKDSYVSNISKMERGTREFKGRIRIIYKRMMKKIKPIESPVSSPLTTTTINTTINNDNCTSFNENFVVDIFNGKVDIPSEFNLPEDETDWRTNIFQFENNFW